MFLEVPPSPGRDEQLATTRRRSVRVTVFVLLVAVGLALSAAAAPYVGALRADVTEWLNDFYP